MPDEIIDEVRHIRHQISRECNHDIHKVVAYYRAFQDELLRSGKYRFFDPAKAEKAPIGEQDVNHSNEI